jgi:hypothetical protein
MQYLPWTQRHGKKMVFPTALSESPEGTKTSQMSLELGILRLPWAEV